MAIIVQAVVIGMVVMLAGTLQETSSCWQSSLCNRYVTGVPRALPATAALPISRNQRRSSANRDRHTGHS
jgi:hypothetical protein